MTKTDDDERDRMLARLEKALAEALARNEAAEAIVEDQRQRLKALGTGREETMRALAEARAELKRVTRERDELRKQVMQLDGMQTATIALSDEMPELLRRAVDVPSLEELMTALGDIQVPRAGGHLHQPVENAPDLDGSEEMISPQLVFPEQFAETARPSAEASAGVDRLLVLLDAERPVKYPLYKSTMTIGRADVADIRVDNGFLSRLHARVLTTADGVTIEDFDSKNGIRVNAKPTRRQTLHHGDVVDLGQLRFRFIDTAADKGE